MPDREGVVLRTEETPARSPPVDLTAEEHRILAYASAIGSEFDFQLLVAAMAANEEELAEHLEALVHRGILIERLGGDRFAFTEEEFRARIYRSLTESRLRVLHRKIAEALESIRPGPGPGLYADLGRHYFLGKVASKSLDYNRRAGEAARLAEEPERAIHHFERVLLDLATSPEGHEGEEANISETLGDLYYSVGNFPAADRYYGQALDKVGTKDPGLTARLLLSRSEIARDNLATEAAAKGALEARRLFEASGDLVGVATTHRLMARLAFHRGDFQGSLDENMYALELLEGNRDPRLIGRLAIDMGNSFAQLGPDVKSIAIEWYERAVQQLTAVSDWLELSRAYHNLAVAVGESHPQDGLDYLTKAREAADRGHDPRSAGWSLLTGVEMRLALGQMDEAERDNEQAFRLLQRLSDPLGLEQVELNRGEIAERRGQWEEAERGYSGAVDRCRKLGLPADEAEALYRLARLRSKVRDWDGARDAFLQSERLGLPEVRPNLAKAFAELKRTLAVAEAASVPAASAPSEDASEHPPL
jgi:tetratricopeptide (TPR) repeat protein